MLPGQMLNRAMCLQRLCSEVQRREVECHRNVRHKLLSAIFSLADHCADAIARSGNTTLLNLSFQCPLLLCSQRTAYQIAEIVDADDIVERIVHRLITREIGLAEDRRLTIERFIHVDGLDYLALRIENGAYGSRAVIPHYVGRDADIVCPALDKDRGSAPDFLHDLVNHGEIVIHLRGAKK